MLFAFSTSVTIAEGDKERGDKATGFSCQVQEQDPPPFQQWFLNGLTFSNIYDYRDVIFHSYPTPATKEFKMHGWEECAFPVILHFTIRDTIKDPSEW